MQSAAYRADFLLAALGRGIEFDGPPIKIHAGSRDGAFPTPELGDASLLDPISSPDHHQQKRAIEKMGVLIFIGAGVP
jgi:hypothetical protein